MYYVIVINNTKVMCLL